MPDPDLENLPDWVKSLGLPAEAAAAIDRYWKPIWDELRLLPEHPGREEQLEFEAVHEPEPGAAWQARFEAMWPAYRAWYPAGGRGRATVVCGGAAARCASTCRSWCGMWERVVDLAGGGDLAARLLSLYRPPGFIVGCSQGAWTRDEPVLVRNYDYPAARLEGIVCMTQVGRAAGDRHERLPVGPARRHQRLRPGHLTDVRRPPRRRRRLRDPARRALRARDLRHRRRGARGAGARSPSTRRRTSRCWTGRASS